MSNSTSSTGSTGTGISNGTSSSNWGSRHASRAQVCFFFSLPSHCMLTVLTFIHRLSMCTPPTSHHVATSNNNNTNHPNQLERVIATRSSFLPNATTPPQLPQHQTNRHNGDEHQHQQRHQQQLGLETRVSSPGMFFFFFFTLVLTTFIIYKLHVTTVQHHHHYHHHSKCRVHPPPPPPTSHRDSLVFLANATTLPQLPQHHTNCRNDDKHHQHQHQQWHQQQQLGLETRVSSPGMFFLILLL